MTVWSLITLAAAAAVILALGVYAVLLWRRVWRVRAEQRARHAEARADQVHSIRVLAAAVAEGELNLTEGAIRLKVLLDNLLPAHEGERRYPAVYALHDATTHMPRRLARRQRPRAEIERLDAEREILEAQYRERVIAEARSLLTTYAEPRAA